MTIDTYPLLRLDTEIHYRIPRTEEGSRDIQIRQILKWAMRWWPPSRENPDDEVGSRGYAALTSLDGGDTISASRAASAVAYVEDAIKWYGSPDAWEPFKGRNAVAIDDFQALLDLLP